MLGVLIVCGFSTTHTPINNSSLTQNREQCTTVVLHVNVKCPLKVGRFPYKMACTQTFSNIQMQCKCVVQLVVGDWFSALTLHL